jgi:hypothetical protein
MRVLLLILNCIGLETAREVLQVGGAAQGTGSSTRNFTHLRGFQNFDLTLVRLRGLCLCSREFHSPRLKLTRMGYATPLRVYLT